LRGHLTVGCDSLKVVILVRVQTPQPTRIRKRPDCGRGANGIFPVVHSSKCLDTCYRNQSKPDCTAELRVRIAPRRQDQDSRETRLRVPFSYSDNKHPPHELFGLGPPPEAVRNFSSDFGVTCTKKLGLPRQKQAPATRETRRHQDLCLSSHSPLESKNYPARIIPIGKIIIKQQEMYYTCK